MKPASTRVLDIPEVVDLYSSAETGGTNLWEFPEGLRALARNIRHVRTWRSWVFFFIYYFHATAAHDDNNNGNSNDNGMSISSLDPSNIPSSSTPHLFSSATRDAFGLVPLLAMTQLLRDLHVDGLSVRDFWSAQMITSTLLDMVNLERLAINLCRRGSYHGIAKALFFGCPSSIKRLCLERVHPCLREGFDSSDIGSRIENGGVEALPRRTTHLVNVRDLSLEDWKDSATKEELLSIFQQCSGLETIRMVYHTVPVGFDAGDIGRICPRLHNIKLTGEALSPYKIMETLPENRLRTLDYYSLTRPLLDAATARRTFPRHACSLQMVKIHSPAQSSALRMILALCEGLEYVDFHSTCIDLSDAVASPWASTKMRYLSMNVNIIPSQSSPPGTDYIPYYLKTPPSPPTAEDKHMFSQLEAFYRQIAELKNLVFLYIGRTYFNARGSIVGSFKSEERPLPGMLHLRGSDVDRPGFLDLLRRLIEKTPCFLSLCTHCHLPTPPTFATSLSIPSVALQEPATANENNLRTHVVEKAFVPCHR
ncbi:hypothetical protein F5H01DRAFT_370321 [Linnemannia elongata]|nr:hypothetical protein F5H01DRAFT_370321 [Linnemannia elongata]